MEDFPYNFRRPRRRGSKMGVRVVVYPLWRWYPERQSVESKAMLFR